MTFARRVYLVAATYGLIVLLPQYFLAGKIGRDFPPAITHAEYFYGFIGIAVAWQVVFLIISRDPLRYRPLMLASILEKAAFSIPAVVLFSLGRLSGQTLAAGLLDATLGAFFAAAYLRTAAEARDSGYPGSAIRGAGSVE